MVLFMTHYTVSIALKDSCWNNSQKVIRLLLVSYVECTDVPISAITVLYRDMERFYMLLYWSRHLFLFLFLEGHCLHTVQEPLQVCEIRLSGPVAMDNHVVHEGQWSEYFRRK